MKEEVAGRNVMFDHDVILNDVKRKKCGEEAGDFLTRNWDSPLTLQAVPFPSSARIRADNSLLAKLSDSPQTL